MPATASAYTRSNPFPAHINARRLLTGPESDKETLHMELSLAGSGLHYECGDSLGIFPANDPELVDEILGAAGLDAGEKVDCADGTQASLKEVLLKRVSLRDPSRQLLAAILEQCPDAEELKELVDPEARAVLNDWLDGREVIDVLLAYPRMRWTACGLLGVLRKLQPRLYSIASSPKHRPGQVDITVAVVRYDLHGRQRKGVCTTFLADRCDGNPVPVFIHSAKHFRPPENPDAAVIMIGPGTGIAPFRGFLQEREATGAKGRSWLFFGDRKCANDFLYEDEIRRWLDTGVLNRLDTAFSRDQAAKVYVQHRMVENAQELWEWLQDGAYFYVCGDASRMAKDVDDALHRVVAQAGGKSTEEAAAYVAELKKTKRYRKDVY